MSPVIHPRADWGARAATRASKLTPSKIGIVDVHWPGSKGRLARDRPGVARALRGWQDYHMNGHGWSDIAYNIAVDLAGEVWELRGWDAVDGGVASRSDDVTILLVMGDQDQMTDAMKTSVLWAMGEFERRLGRKLRRTHHGALTQTDCPGPEATAWSKAGFPAPTTNNIQEDDMPSLDEIRQVVREEAGWQGPGAPMIANLYSGGSEWPATALGALQRRLVAESLGPILAAAISAVGEGLDGDQIAAKVQASVTVALDESTASLQAIAQQMRDTIDTAGDQIATDAREKLTAQLSQITAALTVKEA